MMLSFLYESKNENLVGTTVLYFVIYAIFKKDSVQISIKYTVDS